MERLGFVDEKLVAEVFVESSLSFQRSHDLQKRVPDDDGDGKQREEYSCPIR